MMPKTMVKGLVLILFLITVTFCPSCKNSEHTKERPSFETILHTRFFESKRVYDNGVSFNKYGYQLEPEWELFFKNDTTVKIYSPKKEQYGSYTVYYYQDSIFNFAREFWKLKILSRDSLKFQLLRVKHGIISKENSNVYMTFYSEGYMKDNHLDLNHLRTPSMKDTLFVKLKSAEANNNRTKIFAARNPVILESKSPIIEVKKINFEDTQSDALNERYKSDDYLLPEYEVKIHSAYKDFNYRIWAIVDKDGNIRFEDFVSPVRQATPEFFDSKAKVVKGIINIYLNHLLRVIPGNTLGIQHASMINLSIEGIKRGPVQVNKK
jgi:hypothetical protein